jgi:hypothetical protein
LIVDLGGISLALGSDHIKLDGINVSNGTESNIFIGGEGSHWITNSKIHDSAPGGCMVHGTPNPSLCHGIYLTSNNNLIEHTEFYNNNQGYGITNYNADPPFPSNNIYRNNYIHNNGNNVSTTFGVVLTSGVDNQFYNNLVINNANGISTNLQQFIYNNTVYGNGIGFDCGAYCYSAINSDSQASSKNNIIFNNSINSISGGAYSSNNLTTNPNFVNAAGNDFHLQSSSLAINYGANLYSQGVTTDFDGVARPTSGAFEAGAYEYGGTNTCNPVDCAAPPAGCTYQNPAYDANQCLISCGTLSCTSSTKFTIGDRIYAADTASVNVRQTAGGTLLGTQPPGAQGTVTQGPTAASIGGTGTVFNWWFINFDSGVDGWVGEGPLEKVTGTPPPPPPTCTNLWNSTLSVPASFGASFNWFTTAKELLINVLCSSSSSASVSVGNGTQIEYIYKTGYTWTNNQWTPFNYSGQTMDSSGNWFIGSATANLSIADLTQKQSVLAYICEWTGVWKCGCNDSACSTSYWNLQQFKQ